MNSLLRNTSIRTIFTATLVLLSFQAERVSAETIKVPEPTDITDASGQTRRAEFSYEMQVTVTGTTVVLGGAELGIDYGDVPYKALAEAITRYPAARVFAMKWHAGQPGQIGDCDCASTYNRARKTMTCHGTRDNYDDSGSWVTTLDASFKRVDDAVIRRLATKTANADIGGFCSNFKDCGAKLKRMTEMDEHRWGNHHTIERHRYP